MLHCPRARFRKGICGPEFVVRWPFSRVRLPLNRIEIARVSYFTHAVGNRLLFAIFSQPILVRWLSGRKQRFAKAPYLSKGTEGSNPSLTAMFPTRQTARLRRTVHAHVREMRTCSTGGARSAWVKIPPLRDLTPEPTRSVG